MVTDQIVKAARHWNLVQVSYREYHLSEIPCKTDFFLCQMGASKFILSVRLSVHEKVVLTSTSNFQSSYSEPKLLRLVNIRNC